MPKHGTNAEFPKTISYWDVCQLIFLLGHLHPTNNRIPLAPPPCKQPHYSCTTTLQTIALLLYHHPTNNRKTLAPPGVMPLTHLANEEKLHLVFTMFGGERVPMQMGIRKRGTRKDVASPISRLATLLYPIPYPICSQSCIMALI